MTAFHCSARRSRYFQTSRTQNNFINIHMNARITSTAPRVSVRMRAKKNSQDQIHFTFNSDYILQSSEYCAPPVGKRKTTIKIDGKLLRSFHAKTFSGTQKNFRCLQGPFHYSEELKMLLIEKKRKKKCFCGKSAKWGAEISLVKQHFIISPFLYFILIILLYCTVCIFQVFYVH